MVALFINKQNNQSKTKEGGMIQSFSKDQLQVKVFQTRYKMSSSAANDVVKAIQLLLLEKQELNMIFAAAPSQNEFLELLCAHAGIDWQRINAFHMDEYVGLPADAPQGFGNFLKERIFDKKPFRSVNILDGNNPDLNGECERYTSLLRRYPVDIVCMGIGENGHIAFNDPHVARFDDPVWVKVVDLDDTCRRQQVNDGCFSSVGKVPTHALTLTIPALTVARYTFCVVPSRAKAKAVYNTLNHPVSEACPAGILRRKKDAVLYIDRDSAMLLNNEICGDR
jgi:glucosamine-6-phosphate deaminase